MPGDGPAVLDSMVVEGHESVMFAVDRASGLKAIIAIHSTALGPALGGTRFFPYADEAAAITDVLRLSEGMTFKAAAAGLNLGGGKAVIMGDPDELGTEALLEAYGRAVDRLGGAYVTAEDVGTTVEMMAVVARQTSHVKGLPRESGGSGDPSPMTARGVHVSMQAVANTLWGTPSLAGRTVAIQGVGKVGARLAERLAADDVRLLISDVDTEALETVAASTGAEIVEPPSLLEAECDILAPCALGAVLSADTIPRLRCAAVVGSANNQLAEDEDADRLAARGILYAPDYVVNAGGIVNIGVEVETGTYAEELAGERVDQIADRLTEILQEADRRGVTPSAAAEQLARQRIASGSTARPS
ncbi:MAG: Glu/Leu/Phe/Val dehydrogenase [Acidimicrobiia bacterium]|nr:Glu/Leu/Phe/Val dehydrogenase [Acidimicrobiia bacterium]